MDAAGKWSGKVSGTLTGNLTGELVTVSLAADLMNIVSQQHHGMVTITADIDQSTVRLTPACDGTGHGSVKGNGKQGEWVLVSGDEQWVMLSCNSSSSGCYAFLQHSRIPFSL